MRIVELMNPNGNSDTIITVYFGNDPDHDGLSALDGGLPNDRDAQDRAFEKTEDARRLNVRLGTATPLPLDGDLPFPSIEDSLIGFRVFYDEDGDVAWVTCHDNADGFLDEFGYSYIDVAVSRELVESLFEIPVVDATITS